MDAPLYWEIDIPRMHPGAVSQINKAIGNLFVPGAKRFRYGG
jgi:hypothetical protein